LILPAETDIFPDCLLDDYDQEITDRAWWVVYTKVRQEKRLAADLVAREIPFYLPMVSRRHVYRGRKRVSYIPLFGSYVFLYADAQERVRSLATKRIAHLMPVPDGQRLVNDLNRIRRVIEADVPLTLEGRLSPGDLVRVRHGSFAGVEGRVLSRCRRTRLLVEIHFLQQGISFEIDDCMLEPIS
jgi:transcriptional antiterminator RfaH